MRPEATSVWGLTVLVQLAADDAGGLDELILKYIEGVCWCYSYYYRGLVA